MINYYFSEYVYILLFYITVLAQGSVAMNTRTIRILCFLILYYNNKDTCVYLDK